MSAWTRCVRAERRHSDIFVTAGGAAEVCSQAGSSAIRTLARRRALVNR